MTFAAQSETRGFQTEVKQLLHLMINSLYSNKEIFLRELISNASDAIDKLRYTALSDSALYENDTTLAIYVTFDATAKTITIRDNGIGMTRDEVITNLGTIAHSGTKEFLSKLSGDKSKDNQLIGQFGVGFYSAFIVADRVEVLTRKAGMTEENGVHWTSEASSEYTIENIKHAQRGTTIVLHLKEDASEFLDKYRLKTIITKYSDHIALPIMMEKDVEENKDKDKKEDKAAVPEFEVVNQAKALWTIEKSKIKDEDYKELYKHISHDFNEPLAWVHNKVEGSMEYISLLYLPARAPFDLWNRDGQRGLKLYVQRVFVMDDAEQFLPMYLRFIKGVIDTKDLPLNISREILQNDRVTDKLRGALVKRVLSLLEELAEKEPEKYQKFWEAFGSVLKEGPGEDFANKDRIAKLLRFASTHTDTSAQTTTLTEYISRMKPGQDKIFYVSAESFEAAKNSPHLEVFRQKGIEVLLLSDRVDEWWLGHLTEFESKKFQSVAKGDLDLGSLDDEETKEEIKKETDEFESVLKQMKEVLGDKVKEVRISHRLTSSPSCVVADDNDMGIHMQRIMQAAGQDFGMSKPIFEINPKHVLISNIKTEADDDRFAEWTKLLFEQAVLAEGGHLDNPAEFVQRMNKLLMG
ncbi:MAG: molecular chaperone HtpG [Gammaproteobacteria bacterium]|nr:molecular chaperone HtpG [Gammaproteobacteria bacterium]